MKCYNEIHGASIFDVYDYDKINVEHIEDLEVCLRDYKNEFQNFKLGMAEIIRSFEESVNRLQEAAIRNISARGRARGGNAHEEVEKAVKKPNRPAKRVVETATNLEVFTKSQRLMTFPSKQPMTSPPKRRGAQTLRIRHHHRISRARKWHRYGSKRKSTRTKKKMKKVSRAERRKKLHRHHVRTIVLCEIRNYQRITKLLICKLSFQRLVHDRGRHRNSPMKHSSDLPRQPSHNMLVWSLAQTRFLRQCVNHGCYHGSNKKLLEFGVGGFHLQKHELWGQSSFGRWSNDENITGVNQH